MIMSRELSERSPEKTSNADSRRTKFQLPPRLKADEKTRRQALTWGTQMQLQIKEKREQKIKQNKRAETMLRTWEAMLADERRETQSRLQQRVQLQRQLIRKMSEYQMLKQSAALEEGHMRKLEEEKAKREALIRPNLLRKVTVRRKPDQVESDLNKSQASLQLSNPAPFEPCFNDHVPAAVATPAVISLALSGNVQSKDCKPQSHIFKCLGDSYLKDLHDNVDIEDMWCSMKAYAELQLRPIKKQSRILKQSTSPSVREYMEVFDQPPLCDSTGKRIPILTLFKEKQSVPPSLKSYTMKVSKNSTDIHSKCGQYMAEKVALGGASSKDWFPQEEEKEDGSANDSSISHSTIGLVETHIHRTPLSVREDGFSCLKKTRQVCKRNTAKAMINAEPPDPIVDQQKRTVTDMELAAIKWQPLSLNALSDLPSTSQRTVSGSGQFSHGQHHLWKQKSVLL